MDWGVISGCSSLLGLILALVRLGEWKARQEVRLNNLEKHCETSDGKVDALAVLQSQQNLVLTEIKTRLEFLVDSKMQKLSTFDDLYYTVIGISLFVLLTIMFILFTFAPPLIPLFKDPISDTYGI